MPILLMFVLQLLSDSRVYMAEVSVGCLLIAQSEFLSQMFSDSGVYLHLSWPVVPFEPAVVHTLVSTKPLWLALQLYLSGTFVFSPRVKSCIGISGCQFYFTLILIFLCHDASPGLFALSDLTSSVGPFLPSSFDTWPSQYYKTN